MEYFDGVLAQPPSLFIFYSILVNHPVELIFQISCLPGLLCKDIPTEVLELR
jgi:hypothetical protein